MARMTKAKATWNLGVEAELLIREHDESRPEALGGPAR